LLALAQRLHPAAGVVDTIEMSRDDGLAEMSFREGPVPPSTWAGWLALAAFTVGCGAEPSAGDPVVDDTPVATATPEPSAGTTPAAPLASDACQGTRTPITHPDGALLDTLDRLVGSYPMGGVWGEPAQLDYTPKGAPFEGELVVARLDGELDQLEGCRFGVELPVAVTVRTNDGALAESVEGLLLLTNPGDMTTDGSPAPFRAELSAVVDLGALSGSFAVADDPMWTFGHATLRAELTPFGTRGTLGASIEAKAASQPGSAVAPSLEPLLTWHGGDGCVGSPYSDPDPALFPASTDARQALDAALELASGQTYRAKYSDGTETRVALELAPLSLLCATSFWASYWHFPTRVRLRTDDGRLDVSIGVTIDPGFAQLHFNQLTEVPWAYPPSRVDEQIGHIDIPASDYAQIGIESWFDLTPEPAGWIKVLGYDAGACALCDELGGCIDCAFDQRVELLSLFIGAQTDHL
jgi:hypothetical protein